MARNVSGKGEIPLPINRTIFFKKIYFFFQSLIILDSNSIDSTTTSIDQSFNLSELFNNHQEGGENQQQHQKQKFLIKFDSKKEEILLKLNGEEVSRILKISRIFVSKFLNNPWMEIENLQLKLKNQHRETLAVVELPSKERRPSSNTSSTPFLFCAFQSVACQLEQEVSHLVTYPIFGSFGNLPNINAIWSSNQY